MIGKDEQIEIEPNEDDEILCDFLIDKDIQTIQVYSYLKNAEKPGRDIGWGITTIHDLKSKGGPHE
ncbi:MAG: hypothetical protein IIB44_11370 [Candidatus Marinimicrobia bacterium]|nr:hypothetical protein [Candidatus Neomarinimicrobiota bacterium]